MQEVLTYSYKFPEDEVIRLVFDVDGVLADHRFVNGVKPNYDSRIPYPWVSERLHHLKKLGFIIVLQTARYMKKCEGNQYEAHVWGWDELRDWCQRHDIPYDELYLGKASGSLYIDDKAFRVRSDDGNYDWRELFKELNVQWESA